MMRRLVVALDYGTSNSGAAYTIVHDDDNELSCSTDDIEVIRDWPRAAGGRDASDKVPSDIVYNRGGRPVGHGFEASGHGAAPLRWVKLLLEPETFKEKSNRTSRVWESYHALGQKRPVDAVGDYLRWLWKRVQAAVVEKEGEDEDSALFDPKHLTVVLTVPASWSAPAKQRMATAAVLAGIPEQSIKTLAEPEAAAVCGLQKRARRRQVGDEDCVIICDAGGGTVDAVAYKVRTRDPLSLEQVTVSKGDFCGSSFVNKEFKNQLRSILGDKYDRLSERARDRIDDEFEFNIKRTYNPLGDETLQPHYVTLEDWDDNDARSIRDRKMEVDEAVISTAFDSVMTQIMTLIDDQIDKLRALGLYPKLKGILLVGGFGKSGFLRSRIKQEFPSRNDPTVWAADDSWTAVVRGAVACEASAIGRQALIHTRLSGYNYGIPFVHGGQRKVHWLVHKGQSVQSDMCTEPYGLRIDDQPWLDVDENCLVYVPIVASSEDRPGDRYTDAVTPHATIKCRVPTALRFEPLATLIQIAPSKAWHIPATLVLYFDGALISFRCRIEDREVGVVEVQYFRDESECTTEEDLVSESEPSLLSALENHERHARADSKISCVSDSSAGEGLAQMPPESHHSSAPAALAIAKETGETSTPPSPNPASVQAKQDRGWKKQFFGLRTKRDIPQEHRKFLAPSTLANRELTLEQKLNGVYSKGWVKRQN